MRRKLLADYLGEARAAWAPGVVVSPAWVRQVTGCSRGLSPKVAAALNAELPTGRHTTAPHRSAGEGRVMNTQRTRRQRQPAPGAGCDVDPVPHPAR